MASGHSLPTIHGISATFRAPEPWERRSWRTTRAEHVSEPGLRRSRRHPGATHDSAVWPQAGLRVMLLAAQAPRLAGTPKPGHPLWGRPRVPSRPRREVASVRTHGKGLPSGTSPHSPDRNLAHQGLTSTGRSSRGKPALGSGDACAGSRQPAELGRGVPCQRDGCARRRALRERLCAPADKRASGCKDRAHEEADQ